MNEGKVARTALVDGLFQRYPEEAALGLDEMAPEEALMLLETQSADVAGRVIPVLNPDLAVQLMRQMDENLFKSTFSTLDPIRTSTLMARLDPREKDELLELLPSNLRQELERLMSYPPDSAGGMMDPNVTSFRTEETVAQALDRIRAVRRPITDLCVVDATGVLQTVIPLQDVALSEPGRTLGQLSTGPAVSVAEVAPRDEVVDVLDARKLLSLPVVSFDGKLVGIIRNDALVEAARNDATTNLQAMAGAGREERALSTPWLAIRKRLPWLQINLVTAFLAAAVVGMFEATIAKYTMLAIFLPVVAGQSGNTGAQSLAVTMRGLALREITPRHWLRVSGKELIAGMANGVAVALTTSAAAYLWAGSIGIPIVIGVSMVFSMAMAGLAGATVPVVLTMLRQDPAQSASIILTTVTDVVGFLSFLGLATILSTTFGMAL